LAVQAAQAVKVAGQKVQPVSADVMVQEVANVVANAVATVNQARVATVEAARVQVVAVQVAQVLTVRVDKVAVTVQVAREGDNNNIQENSHIREDIKA
jgi:hypothetical protein